MGRLESWLTELATTPHVRSAPAARDTALLQSLLGGVWEAGGAPQVIGLGRDSPAQRTFRSHLGPVFWQSPVLRRCYQKERGYAGDFLMMKALYENQPAGDSALGVWLDSWALALPGFEGVRNRRDRMAALLEGEWRRGARRAMSVACGAAPELVLVAGELAFEQIILLDQDSAALDAATQALRGLRNPATPLRAVMPICGSVLRLMRRAADPCSERSLDVIYSMGLFDYLSDKLAEALIRSLWSRLAPGGLLVIGNFNGRDPMRHLMEAALDWYLTYREPSDMSAWARLLPDATDSRVETDESGTLHLFVARRG